MGDRGNIFVREQHQPDTGEEGVYLYTHWNGSRVAQVAAQALSSPEGRSRWSDGSYLARIIFDHLTRDAYDAETGYGISSRLLDNEHPIVIVDPSTRRVTLRDETLSRRAVLAPEGVAFDEFAALHGEVAS